MKRIAITFLCVNLAMGIVWFLYLLNENVFYWLLTAAGLTIVADVAVDAYKDLRGELDSE